MKDIKNSFCELRKGIGIGLVIASVPIIITYIFFKFFDNVNYDLSLFITYSLVSIIGLLLIKKYTEKTSKK